MKLCPHCKKTIGSTGFFGVSKNTHSRTFRAFVQNDYLGCFKTEIEAAKVVDQEIIARQLNYPLNFPGVTNE